MVKFVQVDIGKQYLGKINDFSIARNHFLENIAEDEYVLFIDSDEEAPKMLLDYIKALPNTGMLYYRIRRVNLHDWRWFAAGATDWVTSLASGKARYHGKIHETISGKPFGMIDIPIIHHHQGPVNYPASPYHFHGVRLDTVPFVFRWYAAYNHIVAMIRGELYAARPKRTPD